jgi:hypothetical protein
LRTAVLVLTRFKRKLKLLASSKKNLHVCGDRPRKEREEKMLADTSICEIRHANFRPPFLATKKLSRK